MTFVLLLMILTMTDLCWSQCRTADWWVGSDPKAALAKCRYKTELLGGFYRNSNNGREDVIGLLEAARCCNASVSIQNKTSSCFYDDWLLQLDRNNRWAACPTGYFLQGFYRSNNGWLSNIESGRCCKFNALPKFYLHCYHMNVVKEFDSKGWITCGGDYYITGFFKGGCNQLSCLDMLKCCSLYDGCKMATDWQTEFDRPGWVHCDSSTHYITGLYRHDNWGSNDKIFLLEAAKCCPAPAPDQKKASVCQNGDWSLTLDRTNVWAECPAGYFIRGFRRSSGDWLDNIEEGKCCKPNGFPNRYETCYDESISFDKKGLSKCTKSDYYVTGIYKGNCSQLYCIESLKCCKMNIDECSVSNPCKNGAVCSDTAGSYKCTCQSGYEGINCDNDIDECAKGICKNGATCVNLQGSYRCKCNSGYNGTNCETEINECLYSPCKNGATCVNVVGSYRCDCKSGYTGNDCETGIKYCIPGPCQNGGTCIDLGGSYLCVCANGFFGANCEDSEDDSECTS